MTTIINEGFQKKVLFQLQKLIQRADVIIRNQHAMGSRLINVETSVKVKNLPHHVNFDEEIEEEIRNLPLKDEVEMANFERRLADPDFKRKVMFYLGKIGGGNLHGVTVNLLKKLLSNAVASEYSLLGKKKKKVFKNTAVFNVMVRVIQASDPSATEDKINDITAKWLAQASFRLDRERDKRPIAFTTVDVRCDEISFSGME